MFAIAVLVLAVVTEVTYVLQVGACIVNDDNKIVGIGYNGMPKNCHDDEMPWKHREIADSWLDSKYPYGNSLNIAQLLFLTI